MEDRKQFTFYASFYEAAQTLESPEDRAALYEAICAYALRGEEHPLTGTAAGMFTLILPILDAGRNKAQNCLCRKQRNNKPKTKQYQTGKKKEIEKENKNENEIEIENEIENKYLGVPRGNPTPDKPARARFAPPDESELIAFFREAGSDKAEAEAFLDYYKANGWKVGKNSMEDWKAAVRTWIRRSGQYGRTAPAESKTGKRGVLDEAMELIESGDFSFMGG